MYGFCKSRVVLFGNVHYYKTCILQNYVLHVLTTALQPKYYVENSKIPKTFNPPNAFFFFNELLTLQKASSNNSFSTGLQEKNSFAAILMKRPQCSPKS